MMVCYTQSIYRSGEKEKKQMVLFGCSILAADKSISKLTNIFTFTTRNLHLTEKAQSLLHFLKFSWLCILHFKKYFP